MDNGSLIDAEDIKTKGREIYTKKNVKIYTEERDRYYKLWKDGKLKFGTKKLMASEPAYKLLSPSEEELPQELRDILPKWWSKKIIIGDFRTGLRIIRDMDHRQNRILGSLAELWGQYPYWIEKGKKELKEQNIKGVVIGNIGFSFLEHKIEENIVLEIIVLIPELGEENKNIEDILEDLTRNHTEISEITDFIDDELLKNAIKENIKIECNNLTFTERLLVKRDLEEKKLYDLENIPGIPKYGDNVVVIDCKTGNEFHVSIDHDEYIISDGLTELWDDINKRVKLSIGDIIGIAVRPTTDSYKHRIYVRVRRNTKQPGEDIAKQSGEDIAKQSGEDIAKQSGEDIAKQPGEDIAKQPGEDIAKQPGEDIAKQSKEQISYDSLFPVGTSEDDIEEFKSLYEKEINYEIENDKKTIIESKVNDFQRKKKEDKELEEKKRLTDKLKDDEQERRRKIDDSISKASLDSQKALHYKTFFLEGPPGTSKTYDAEQIAREIANIYTGKDLSLIELENMGYVYRVEFDPNWDKTNLMGGMTYHVEEEDKEADSIKPINMSGLLKKINKKAIGLTIGRDEEYIKNNNHSKIFNEYQEKVKKVDNENIFKYTQRIPFIIDEASRAPFEKVFGGNYTILEKQRRLGEAEQTIINLPSGEKFGLAPSVIVICTRNIVDKSAKSIDLGIMRRFPRKYCKPDHERLQRFIDENESNLKKEDIYERLKNSKDAWIKINNGIGKKLGIDYQIGHTYLFVETKFDLITAWTDFILPTVVDRFNRNYDDVSNVLFGYEKPEWVSREKGIYEFKDIKEIDKFIEEINSSDQNE